MKKTPGDIIILCKCTKNHDEMLYYSGDMDMYKNVAQNADISKNGKNQIFVILRRNNRSSDHKFIEIRDVVVANIFCLKKTSKIKVGLKKMEKSHLLTFTSIL